MGKIVMRVAAGVFTAALTLISSISVAQQPAEVTVQASRFLNSKVAGQTSTGIAISDVTLNYKVSPAGLDLASQSGGHGIRKTRQ